MKKFTMRGIALSTGLLFALGAFAQGALADEAREDRHDMEIEKVKISKQINADNIAANKAAIAAIQLTPGPQGPAGPAGTNGLDGAVGAAGPAGTNGLDGAVGAAGPAGPAGTNGLDGAVGAAGPAGTAGTNGLMGLTGAPGADGAAGADGLGSQAHVDAICALYKQHPSIPLPTFCPPPTVTSKIIFITSGSYNGNLGGLVGADAKCQGAAGSAALPGTYKALLSSTSVDPSTRLTHSPDTYVDVTGTTIALNWADLVDGTIATPIVTTEFGAPLTRLTNGAWTSTSVGGVGACRAGVRCCNDWTASVGRSFIGLIGDPTAVTQNWMVWSKRTCDQLHHLYCVQQ